MASVSGVKTVWQGWVYDVVTAINTSTLLSFFTVQQGQAGKTKADTNIVTPATFTGKNAIKVKSHCVKMRDMVYTPNALAIQRGALTLFVNDTPVPDPIPLEFIMGGSSLIESVRMAGVVAGEYRAISGPGYITNVMTFSEPGLVIIEPGDTFRADVEWANPALALVAAPLGDDTVRLRYILFGPRSKPTM